MALVLYTFWRSQAAFRVRIALRLKRLQAEMVFVDLIKSEQLADSYRNLNPAMLLPALIDECQRAPKSPRLWASKIPDSGGLAAFGDQPLS
jgi:maleylacetoacetate isomerase